MELKNWYFGVNEGGLRNTFGQVLAAVRSCRANTPLKPHCVYVGRPIPRLQVLRNLGVKIIRHEPLLKRELQIGYGPRYGKFAGHWLRADLPVIETAERYILYTDIDVLFLNWRPDLLKPPAFLAAAPEARMDDMARFNSGVMVLNVEAMRAELPAFHAAIKARLLGDFVYPSHDQRSFNDHFAGRFDHLDLRLNWKPYWGMKPDASIVHFHGPKPRQILMVKGGKFLGSPDQLATLARDPVAYLHYHKLWAKYAPPHPQQGGGVPNPASRFLLAKMLIGGIGVEPDWARARTLLEGLAAKDFPGARWQLHRLKLKAALRGLGLR